jgi:hypothetical protein
MAGVQSNIKNVNDKSIFAGAIWQLFLQVFNFFVLLRGGLLLLTAQPEWAVSSHRQSQLCQLKAESQQVTGHEKARENSKMLESTNCFFWAEFRPKFLKKSNCSEGLKTVQVSLKANNVKEVDGSGILEKFR